MKNYLDILLILSALFKFEKSRKEGSTLPSAPWYLKIYLQCIFKLLLRHAFWLVQIL